MATLIGCPNSEMLRKLADSELAGAEKEATTQHVALCEDCAAQWRRLMGNDTMFESRSKEAEAPIPQCVTSSPDDTAEPKTEAGLEATNDWFNLSQDGPARSDSATPAPDVAQSQQSVPYLSPPEAPDELGRLSGYRVLKRLGEGGMGLVLLAEDVALKRQVALKVMRPALAENPEARQRFLREAQAIAAIQHDHIVTIYQVGDANGAPFFAMQLLTGMPLDEWLRRVPKPTVAQIARIGKEIARGLAGAHERGLIHRDIKPANIWLEAPSGRVKILDFGLARIANEATHVTKAGNLIGTPAYMAPELVQDGTVDFRADLFSLGVVLFELSAGRRPFEGSDPLKVIAALALQEPPSVRELNSDIPTTLADLVTRLLAKDASQRPESARYVVEALLGVERQLASDRRKTEPGTAEVTAVRPTSQRRRWSMVAAIIGILTVALLGGIVILAPTPKGTLEIKTDDPDVKVIVEQAGKRITIIDPKSNQTVELDAGTYQVKLAGGKELKLETDTFTLTRGDKKIVEIRRLPAMAIAAKAEQPADIEAPVPLFKMPERGFLNVAGETITDFTEIHDAPLDAFKGWLDKLKTDGFRPIFLGTPSAVGADPRFNAIAVKDGKNVPWEAFTDWPIAEWQQRATEPRRQRLRMIARCTYGKAADRRAASLWVTGGGDVKEGRQVGAGSLGTVGSLILESGKNGLRPLFISVQDEPDGGTFASTILVPDNGVRWEFHDDMSLAQFKKLCDDCHTRAMRPNYVYTYGGGGKLRFVAIVVENRENVDWYMKKYMVADEYAEELPRAKRRGLRPLSVSTYLDDNGVAHYAALWVRYRMDFDVWLQLVSDLPPKKQVEAIQDKLKDRNPNFQPEMLTARFKNGELQAVELRTEQVTDLAPLRALPKMKKLTLVGNEQVKTKPISISGLAGLKLTVLQFMHVQPEDLSPLKDMPLEELHLGGGLALKNAALLRQIPTLKSINGKTVEEFFKE